MNERARSESRLADTRRRVGYQCRVASERSDATDVAFAFAGGWAVSDTVCNGVPWDADQRWWVARLHNYAHRFRPCALDWRHVDYLGDAAEVNR